MSEIRSELRTMSTKRFVDTIKREYKAGHHFCFILGAGASFTSGIRTGEMLMREWRKELLKETQEEIAERAEIAGYTWDECKHLFVGSDSELNNADYFKLYDLYFAGTTIAGYDCLEQEMEGKTPNVGYYYLSSILENTDNKLVITTNFDSLAEDALFHCYNHHPLVLGHERLANYIEKVNRKSVIAKIHRDLLMEPMNRAKELSALDKGWVEPLKSVLSRYIPIVIGYAGGDGTLMSLLKQLDLKGIFWCEMKNKKVSEDVEAVICKNKGYRINIDGFDELMFLLVQALPAKHPSIEEIEKISSDRCAEYAVKHQKLKNKLMRVVMNVTEGGKYVNLPELPDLSTMQSVNNDETDPDEIKYNELYIEAVEKLRGKWYNHAYTACTSAIELLPHRAKAYNLRCKINFLLNQYNEAYEDANKAVMLDPNDADSFNWRGVALESLGRYEEALEDKTKAIELEPTNALYHCSRGATLDSMKRYDEALKDKNKAIELDPDNAEYYDRRGTTLHQMKRYDEALIDKNKAIELDSNNAKYYNSRGVTLHQMKRYDEALKDDNKAIELDPNKAEYYNSRGTTLDWMKRYDEALKDKNKAIELDPNNARYFNSRGATLNWMKRYDEALSDTNKAIELEPNNAEYYHGRGVTLDWMKWYDEALKDKNKAIELDPNNAEYYNGRGTTLDWMKRYDEALKDTNKAVELEPTNARYYHSRGATFNNTGWYKEALQDLNKAIELEPNNAEYYIHRSMVYDALGRRQLAIMDKAKAKRLSNK